MKKNLLYLFALICSMSLFTACSDDDDKGAFIDENLAGVYKGEMDITLSLFPEPLVEDMIQKVYISRVGDDAIQMELRDFSVALAPGGQPLPLGTIKVERCVVTDNAGTYSFTGTQTLNLTSVGSCDVKVTGTIVGGKIDMDIAVGVKSPEMTVSVTFEGEKLAADQSSEAKILDFGFGDKVKGKATIDGTRVLFTVEGMFNADVLLSIVPVIKISDNATIVVPSSDEEGEPIAVTEPQNFNNTVSYMVTSEDGITITNYTVTVVSSENYSYTFENWLPGVEGQEPDMTFYEPIGGWSSSNTGAHFLKALSMADSYVVTQVADAHSGKSAARIETIDSKGADFGFVKVPKVTTGTLFLGTFITDMTNTLNSTKFGFPFYKKPVSVKGYYKFTPGKTFYRCESPETCHVTVVDPTTIDECMISAVLYEVSTFEDPEYKECLTGVDAYTSDKIVAIAQLADGTAKADWTSFELKLDYKKAYDATKKYRFAIICSSSKDGDKFNGAPNSVLFVDDLELVSE